MKSPPGQSIALGRVTRDADATMTISAERLQLMTTDATRIVLTRALRMHREPVVRMHFARTHASIVTIGALVFGVALGAERAVVRCHCLVTLDEVRRVRSVVHPLRRHQLARREARDHAPVRLRRVTHDALALRLPLRRATHVVTREAPRHTRKLSARCKLQLANLTVALTALNVSRSVLLVREHEVRVRKNHLRDRAIRTSLVTHVAVDALAVRVGPSFDVFGVRVIDVMTPVALRSLRHEPIGNLVAVRYVVTRGAFLLLVFDVLLVIEADGDRLRWKDFFARHRRRR